MVTAGLVSHYSVRGYEFSFAGPVGRYWEWALGSSLPCEYVWLGGSGTGVLVAGVGVGS